MPLQISQDSPPLQARNDRYPAVTKQSATTVDGISTDASSTFFTDKILITIVQDGRLAQWVRMTSSNGLPQQVKSILSKLRKRRSTSLWTLGIPISQIST